MATYNVTAAGGTTGHPANGRTPYLVENTIDVSAVNGDSGTADGDILQCLDIPAETLIMEAGVEVITALSSSATIDLGITGGDPDRYVDGDTNAIAVSSGSAANHTFGSAGSNEFAFLYGHMSGVATVNHIAKTELISDPDSFADVVRGLHVFGRKILRSDAVLRGVITIG